MMGIRHLQPVSPEAATGLVAEVYDQVRREFGLLPPIPLHSPNPELLASAWCVLRETLVVGAVPRPVKEALAAAISRLNRCPYCIDAHTLMLAAADEPAAARALAAGRAPRDERLRRIAAWAAAHRSPGSPELAQPPFPPAETGEMLGTASAFHYINRMAHVFLPETPYPLPPAARWARGFLRPWVAGRFAGLVRATRQPGGSLPLLPDAQVPADLPWARSHPTVGGAYARFAAAVDLAGRAALPEAVRDRVVQRLAAWNGTDSGLGRGWLEQAVADLPGDDQPAGRLALLTAFAPYQIDDDIVAGYRRTRPDDPHLLGAVAWTSYVTARQISQWLWQALPEGHRQGTPSPPAA